MNAFFKEEELWIFKLATGRGALSRYLCLGRRPQQPQRASQACLSSVTRWLVDLFAQYWASYKNENLAISLMFLPKWVLIFSNTK